MDRFHQLRVFLAVAEQESFAAAARRLRLSPPAVTRAVSMLEESLGVRLLSRTTRIVRLTEVGARYLEDARRILADLEDADQAAAGVNATPRGQLAVTAPVLFGKHYVIPILVEYQSVFPETSVSALFVDRVVNLVEEGLDVGIRIGELPDSSLRAVRVGHVRRVVCASPRYLERHGIPRSPADLREHQIVSATGQTPTPDWVFRVGTERMTIRISPRMLVNTNDGALEAARAGFGLTRILSYQVAPELVSGELKIVLAEFETVPLPVHVVHREGRHASAKVRSFVDLAVDRLRSDPALN